MERENVNVIDIDAFRPRAIAPGVVMQIAAEAGSETKRLIEADAGVIQGGPHRDLVVNGLRNIANGYYGEDYHGVSQVQAEDLLHRYEWPLEAEAN